MHEISSYFTEAMCYLRDPIIIIRYNILSTDQKNLQFFNLDSLFWDINLETEVITIA